MYSKGLSLCEEIIFAYFTTRIILQKVDPTNMFCYGNKYISCHCNSQNFVPVKKYSGKSHFAEFTKYGASKIAIYSIQKFLLNFSKWLPIFIDCKRKLRNFVQFG